MQTEEHGNFRKIKDVMVLFFAIAPQTNYNSWGAFMPYYLSYLKHFNPDISFYQVFGSSICFYIGILFCSWIYPSLITILGLRNMLLVGGILYGLNAFSMYTFSSLLSVCISIGMIGFCIKCMFTTNMLYFTEEYPTQSNKLLGISNSGYMVNNVLWGFLYFYLINPNSATMDEVSINNGVEEVYFGWEVAQNFRRTFNIHGLSCLIVTIVCSFLIPNPKKYRPNYGFIMDIIRNQTNSLSGF